MPYAYEPRKGFRITKTEAVVVGQALESVVQRRGEGFSIDAFAAHCQRSRGPLHDIWDKRRQQYIGKAGHEAARYLMNGVQRIIIRTTTSVPVAGRTVYILPKAGKTSGEDEERVFTSEAVSADSDLLQQAEDKMLHQIKGEMDRFAVVVPRARVIRAVQNFLTAY